MEVKLEKRSVLKDKKIKLFLIIIIQLSIYLIVIW